MISILKKILSNFCAAIFLLCGLYACASLGSPQGGPMDEAPPKLISSNPQPNTVGFQGKRIELTFNELVTLDKPSEKVIITPPQKQLPVTRAMGKKVRVEFLDSLVPNTTYTIDFTNSIIDGNEKNPLENFSFAFSTGESVDSLIIGGVLLNAENLEPMPNILVGLHSNMDDSVFRTEPFSRTTKTNDKGQFWVRNIRHGSYRVYALNDKNRDYKFDQPGEEIAFFDSIVIPSFEGAVRHDTIWTDSLTVDTVMKIDYTRFTPDNLLLFLFKEKFVRQYLTRAERSEQYKFTLPFNAPVTTLPRIRFLNGETENPDLLTEISNDKKIINYWLKDSTDYSIDTLHIEVNYLKSDSLNHLVETTDTLKLFERKAPKQKKKSDKDKIEFLQINLSAQQTMDVFDTLKIIFSEPINNFDPEQIKISQKIDTLWVPQKIELIPDSLSPLIYYSNQRWNYDTEFQIEIDSAAITSIYDKWNDKLKSTFKFRKEEEYGNLYVIISGYNSNGFGELLSSSDECVKKSPLENGEVDFYDIKPGKYYLRFIEDSNNNGIWDTGNFSEKKQPENVFYYPGSFEIRQNWENEQSWDINSVPIEQQKPMEITKNKPEERKKKKNTNPHANQKNNTTNNNIR